MGLGRCVSVIFVMHVVCFSFCWDLGWISLFVFFFSLFIFLSSFGGGRGSILCPGIYHGNQKRLLLREIFFSFSLPPFWCVNVVFRLFLGRRVRNSICVGCFLPSLLTPPNIVLFVSSLTVGGFRLISLVCLVDRPTSPG